MFPQSSPRFARAPERKQLPDGTEVLLRSIQPGDCELLARGFQQFSDESRYRRFFRATPRYDASLRRHITDVATSLVWLALDGDRCVGEARVVTSTRQPCGDLAVTVADDFHGRGLGSRLARRAVAEHLRSNDCVSFSILPGNTSATRIPVFTEPISFPG